MAQKSVRTQLQARLFAAASVSALAAEARELTVRVHRDTVDLLRDTLDFARRVDPTDERTGRDYAISTGRTAAQRDAPWRHLADRLWAQMHLQGRQLWGSYLL